MKATILVEGKIPAKTVCPWKQQCQIAEAGRCFHKGQFHQVPFSCASARAYDIVGSETDQELGLITT